MRGPRVGTRSGLSSMRFVLCLTALVGLAAPRSHAQGAPPPDTLTVSDALRLARSASPAVEAARLEADARRALVRQADRRPNPTLSADLENLGARLDEGVPLTVRLAQTFERGGDRAARRALAERDVALADVATGAASVDLSAEVRARYATALAAQARAALLRQTLAIADSVVAVVAFEVEVGDRSPVDETRAAVARAEVEAESLQADAALASALARLAALWGGAPAPQAVAVLPPPLPPDAVESRIAQTPALARLQAEADRRAAEAALARAEGTPDLTVSAGVRPFFDGDGSARVGLVAGVALPLTVFSRNADAARAARIRQGAVGAQRQAALLDARAAVEAARGRLLAALAAARTYRETVVPGAESVADRVEEGYREGKFDVLDVLDAQRTLALARASLADADAEAQRAAADLDRLLAPLPDPAAFEATVTPDSTLR